MRDVIVSHAVNRRIDELERYLQREHHFSKQAALRRSRRLREFVNTLRLSGDHALCRFRRWRSLDYRCMSFEGWVFAYEIVPEGVIVRDMSHGSQLVDVEY